MWKGKEKANMKVGRPEAELMPFNETASSFSHAVRTGKQSAAVPPSILLPY
jgi:hypothetical protein